MNDFLSGFEKNKYGEGKPEEIKEEKKEFKKIEVIDHDEEIDENYRSKRKIKKIILITIILIILIASLLMYKSSREVSMNDLVGMNVEDAKIWLVKNNLSLESTSEYSVKYEKDVIISQNKKKNKKVKKGSTVKVILSLGADPDEQIKLPDFYNTSLSEIRSLIDRNKLKGIKVVEEYSSDIESGKVIKVEFKNPLVNNDNYTRKDELTLYISKGKEIFEKIYNVKNFVGLSKTEVETWANNNELTVIFEASSSNTVMEGLVISQSVSPNSKVSKQDEIKFVISSGKAIIVPNYSGVSEELAAHINQDIILIIKHEYNTSVNFGRLISQSKKSGIKLDLNDRTIILTYSLGRPFIGDLSGMIENELAAYFFDYQSKKANVTYTTNYIDSCLPKGSVVSTSKKQEYIDMNEVITVEISKENLTCP